MWFGSKVSVLFVLYVNDLPTDNHVASADRRPVDPPPVVQLRIFEGEAKTDITFSYNANFFLYTTLESARQIAQGRVPQAPTPFPVLTGMPVAGMAYLDRPDPAGYFIFPDLSVRHEGKYRLSFNLFEELKETRDADKESATPSPNIEDRKPSQMTPMSARDHVHFRLEVKSVPFNVFSAKKFPGLAESTQLSRVVAEQGCRVRIRRDVRMRRRDTKANQGYDEFDEENAYARSDRYVTPDMYAKSQMPDRPRSSSHGSVDVPTPYSVEPRRLSAQDLNFFNQPNYQQPPPPVQPAQPANTNYTSHLSFGVPNNNQYAAPTFQPPPAPAPQPVQNYMPNGNGFQYPATHTRQMSVPRNNYGIQQPQAPQQPQFPQAQPYVDTKDYRPHNDYHRATGLMNNPIYPSQVNSYPPVENRAPPVQQTWYPQPAPAPVPRAANPVSGQVLPPLKTLHPPLERKHEPALPASAVPVSSIAPSTPSYDSLQSKFTPYSATPQSATSTSHLGKRSFGTVFDSAHLNQPMHSGMRPSNQGQDVVQVETDEGLVEEDYDQDFKKLLSYKRADGTQQLKKCPSPISE